MKCVKCGCEKFILESTVALTEKYKIYKNGRVSYHSYTENIVQEDMANNDNIVRCVECNVGYVLLNKGRNELINKVDFSKVDLEKDAILIDA